MHGQWQRLLVRTPGEHSIQIRSRKLIDRSSGQPALKLSPQKVPLTTLKVKLDGEHEVIFDPPVPLSIISADQPPKWTHIEANLPPIETLSLRWTEKKETPEEERPHYLSETYQLFTLKDEILMGDVRVDVDVIQGEVKTISLELPEDVILCSSAASRSIC